MFLTETDAKAVFKRLELVCPEEKKDNNFFDNCSIIKKKEKKENESCTSSLCTLSVLHLFDTMLLKSPTLKTTSGCLPLAWLPQSRPFPYRECKPHILMPDDQIGNLC